jgi:hypothetical protein
MNINDVTYDWNFNPFEAYPQYAEQIDVVFTIHWQLYASSGSYKAGSIGTIGVQYTEGQPFTPFNQLTKETVQAWVEGAMNKQNEGSVDVLKQGLANQIQDQITPSVVVLTAPWDAPTVAEVAPIVEEEVVAPIEEALIVTDVIEAPVADIPNEEAFV